MSGGKQNGPKASN